jgi:hypothetical protein
MSEVSESILLSTKKKCNVAPEFTAFDDELISYINVALADLNQLGIGPAEGFQIEDQDSLWTEFYEDPRLNAVQTYVGLKVRLLFDPPQTSFAITMQEDQLREMGFRLQVAQEDIETEEAAI